MSKNQSNNRSMGALGKSTIEVKPGRESDLAMFIDLTGLVYPDLPHPVVLVGMPKQIIPEFGQFMRKGVKPTMIKKDAGNKYYARVSRVLDVYRLCKALDGQTRVHQKAVKAILQKLESRYGRANLEAALKA